MFSPPADNRALLQKVLDLKFLPKKVLSTDCPATASSQATTKWMQTFKLSDELKKQLQQACKNACNSVKALSEEDKEVLSQRAADFGFLIRNLNGAAPVEVRRNCHVCMCSSVVNHD